MNNHPNAVEFDKVSIVFGVFIGARFLGERLTTSRIVGALLVLIGILTIKIGG